MTRRFFAPRGDFRGSEVILKLEETRHLRDVLRLRTGEKVRVFDGQGKEFLCAIKNVAKSETLLEILEETAPAAPESNLSFTLAVALLKGEKFDWVIQKACELGVSKIMPLGTRRSDVKLKDRKETEKKLERWRKIALEAGKQCGRARLMPVETPVDFADFVKTADGPRILFAEKGGASFPALNPVEKITAAIGSEGGWEDAEIDLARENGFSIITLGGRILRAETAAVAVSALLQNHFGDLK